MSVATDTTEDENVILVYEVAPGLIFKEICMDPNNALCAASATVVSIAIAAIPHINLPGPRHRAIIDETHGSITPKCRHPATFRMQ